MIKGAKSWEELGRGGEGKKEREREKERNGARRWEHEVYFQGRDGNKETWKMSAMTQNMNIRDEGKKAKKSECARRKGDKVER